MSTGTYPPGPRVNYLDGLLLASRWRDPLEFLTSIAQKYGDIAHFQVGGRHIFLLNHPDYIRDALLNYYETFSKRHGNRPSKHFLGEGLVVSEGEYHRAQRRVVQPAFHRQRIAADAALVVEHGLRRRERWRHGQRIDIALEMRRLTLGIISKMLFDTDTEVEADEIGDAVLLIFSQFRPFGLPFAKLVATLPHARRVEHAKDRLDGIIYRLIREHRESSEERGDLLSLLMNMENEEGGQMTDLQIRDEALTLFLAGHESVANALTWTWYLIAQHPQVEAKLHEEIDAVLGGSAPTFECVAQLGYTEMVFAEAMRLFPPSWALSRFVAKDYHVGGYMIPADSVVIMSQYVMQRDLRYFPDPCQFDPERWRPEAKAARPRYSYFPFGGGPRRCIGESLAWMQGILLLATLAQRWRMRLVRKHPVELEPVVTLRPKRSIMMELEQRGIA